MNFELSGRLIEKFETRQVSDSFKKREFVVEKKPDNPNLEFSDYIKFQLTQDRCSLIDEFKINDEIRVSFNIRGNRWEKDGKVNYFTNLDVWKIEKTQSDQSAIPPEPAGADDIPEPPEELDDLPF